MIKLGANSPSLAMGWLATPDGVVDNKNNVCFMTTTPATPWPPLRQRRGITTEPNK
ncbi:MAG: hypothetical protein LBJ18_01745 [Rickettsiales bacterium]|nr:hypothetical protein [Rickettsiales bacterium]